MTACSVQVQKQHNAIQASYKRLQRTPSVSKLNITLQELIWAVNVATSRQIAIPKQWPELSAGMQIP